MRSLRSVLSGDFFTRILDAARRQEQRQERVRAVLEEQGLPPLLYRVEGIDDGVLVIHAYSAAAAARLRQSLPSVRRALGGDNLGVADIRVLHRKKND